jgi:hypothetical protein
MSQLKLRLSSDKNAFLLLFFLSSFSNARERGFTRARARIFNGNQFPAFYLAPFVTTACAPNAHPLPASLPETVVSFYF